MSEWIKCSDRLPKVGAEVLIRVPVCSSFNIEGAEYIGEGQFYGAWCSTRGRDCTYKVSHWMPKPQEPEE